MSYRDDAEEWSNKYWLTGTPPVDTPGWQALFDQLVNAERRVIPTGLKYVGGIGYDDNAQGAHAVWTFQYAPGSEPAGLYTAGATEHYGAGDQAAMVEWRTNRKNARGKWVYLRKYFHGVMVENTDPDKVGAGQLTQFDTFALELLDGSWAGGRKIRSQRQDEDLFSHTASPWVTTRTLKRRGKRP